MSTTHPKNSQCKFTPKIKIKKIKISLTLYKINIKLVNDRSVIVNECSIIDKKEVVEFGQQKGTQERRDN